MDEVGPLHLKLSVRLQHAAGGAAEGAAKDRLQVVDENQSLAVVSTADHKVQDVWLPHLGHDKGALIEQDFQSIGARERREEDIGITSSGGHAWLERKRGPDCDVTAVPGILLQLFWVPIHSRNECVLEAETRLLPCANFLITPALETLHDGPAPLSFLQENPPNN